MSIPSTNDRQWITVTPSSPCPICDKADWCRVSHDGDLAACRRESRGAAKTKKDRNGADVFIHRLRADDAVPRPRVHWPKSKSKTAAVTETLKGSAQDLDAAYRLLLDQLRLSEDHQSQLSTRGLSANAVEAGCYRSLPRKGRRAIARRLQEALGDKFVLIPGFTILQGVPTIGGATGLVIPCRNMAGQIVALKIRRDGIKAGAPRFTYLSSTKTGGPGPGAPVHVPRSVSAPTETVRLTEGEIKADIATALSGLPTISVPGVSNWRGCLEVLQALQAKQLRLAFDADVLSNRQVARSLLQCANALQQAGLKVQLERWPIEDGKGIDDLLAAGKEPIVLTGGDYEQAVLELRMRFPDVESRNEPEPSCDIDGLLLEGGAAALFRDQEAMKALAREVVAHPAEAAARRAEMRAQGVSLRDLDRALKPVLKVVRAEHQSSDPNCDADIYLLANGAICRQKETQDGPVITALCNFTAQITQEVTHDDGVERRTMLVLEGRLQSGRTLSPVEVSAEDFPRMNWPVPSWGTQAVVNAGTATKDHLRAALQLLSPETARRTVYGHTGWRKIENQWLYLHGGGAIGAADSCSGISVALPDALGGFSFPPPPSGVTLQMAIRASLHLLKVSRPSLTLPLLATTYRAAIGGADFALHLSGPSGVFKSELTALAQQHFGSSMNARHLPGSWSSTGNALEATAFAAKDALLAVDDFAPTGSTSDVQRLHREADRLLRAQGNHSGRQRMRADGTLRAAKPPRGLILSTGEDVPRGQSLRARLLILEVSPGDVQLDCLSRCQQDAADGKYAAAMCGFLHWLAPHFESVQNAWRMGVAQVRDGLVSKLSHARTPGIVAELLCSWQYFIRFATESGAITGIDAEAYHNLAEIEIANAAAAQTAHQDAAEPTKQYLRLLAAALASGRAHLASPAGQCPTNLPEACGWRASHTGSGDAVHEYWTCQGKRIGWVDDESVFLDPDAAFAEANRLAADQGDTLPVAQRTLQKRLRERGHLRDTDGARGTNTVRRTLEGARREVLHLNLHALGVTELTNLTSCETDGHNPDGSRQRTGQFPGQFLVGGQKEPTRKTDQTIEDYPGSVSLVSSDVGVIAQQDSFKSAQETVWEEGEVLP